MPPTIIDPEDRARVVAAQEETTLEQEWKRIDGREVRHAATIRYEFSDVLATPYGFYVGGNGFNQCGRPPVRDLMSKTIHREEKGFFGLPSIGIQYFGHWTKDGFPNTLLRQPDEALYFPFNPSWTHAQRYIDLLEIDRIPHDYVLFDRMAFCVDVGQNSNRRARYKAMQDTFHSKLPGGNRRVFVSRGNTGASRRLTNEPDLIAGLENLGFLTVSCTAPLDEILAACSGADVTVSIEGSQMSHVFFPANPNAFHLTINPADRFNNLYADYIPSFGMRLGTVVADVDGDGYRVDVPHLLDFLNRHALNAG